MRRLAIAIYRALGWRITGVEFPRGVKKMVIIAAPHTSWHDFYMGLLFRKIIGCKMHFVGKKELFRWPLGWYFRAVGGKPLDRTGGLNKVQAITKLYEEQEEFRLTLAPEGTRKKVEVWKTGFYYIAVAAKVPILRVAMDFENREHRIAPLFYPTGEITKDLPEIKSFFANVKGKIPTLS